MECYCSSCDITGGVIPPSYKLQEGCLSSQCLIKFSWKVSRSERCFQHVSNLCVTLELHIQLTLITTDFKRELLVSLVRIFFCESSSRRLVPVYQNIWVFFLYQKKPVAALQFYAGYEKHAIVILLSLCYPRNRF